jgi:hypothetical protein
MPDITLGDAFQGGATAVAMYLAIQIKGLLTNHEIRITALETRRAITRPSKRSRRPRK